MSFISWALLRDSCDISWYLILSSTFRDSYLYRPVKGLYVKFRTSRHTHDPGLIEDILFENITIDRPEQYGMWIGPAQQVGIGQKGFCSADDCSLCWPFVPLVSCKSREYNTFRNITLRNIVIADPKQVAGVIIGPRENRIEGLTFENVIVTKGRLAKADRMKLFPGLAQPIDDKYVTTNIALLLTFIIAMGVALCIFVCLVCKRKIQSVEYFSTDRTPQPGRCNEDGTRYHTSYVSTLLASISSCVCFQRGRDQTKYSVTSCSDDDHGAVPVGFLATINMFSRRGLFFLVVLLLLATYITFWWTLCNIFVALNVGDPYTCEGVTGAIVTGSTSPIPSCFAEHNNASKLKKNSGLIMVATVVCPMHYLIAVVYLKIKALRRKKGAEYDLRPRCSTEDTAEISGETSFDEDFPYSPGTDATINVELAPPLQETKDSVFV